MADLIDAFPRRDGELRAGELGVAEVAGRFGTPLYLYDGAVLRNRFEAVRSAFRDIEHLVAYSVKANGNLALLDRLARWGAGADIVSGGELFRALRAGMPPDRIVFAGVGKRAVELRSALRAGVHAIHVESEGELRLLEGLAREVGRPAPVGIRINPDVRAPTPHEYTRTGDASTKFGVPVERALELFRRARASETLRVRGVDVHIGSQIVEVEPYRRALERSLEVVGALRDDGIEVEYLDLGGGFGVPERPGEGRLDLEALADVVVPAVREAELRLILEPGRAVVGESGLLVTRVLHVKEQGPKTFVVTDAGMSELLRPSHYGGYHVIEPVVSATDDREETVDVVGPICESGDFLGRDRTMPLPEPGELLAVRNAGAYAFVMSMQYNGRPRPAEVLLEGGRAHLVRRREVNADLIRGETIPPMPGTEGRGRAGSPASEAPDSGEHGRREEARGDR